MNKIITVIDNLKYNDHEILTKTAPGVFIISDNNINIKLDFVGKGGEGVVYKHNDYAIKFYKNIIPFNKELFVLRLINRLGNKITNNFLTLFGCTQIFRKDVLIVNLIDGNLETWVYNKHTDNEWLCMIFQMLYGVLTMQQCLKMYHSDMKPKNLLFKKINPSVIKYNIKNGKTEHIYNIQTNYTFIISDFGHSSSLMFPKKEYNEKNMSDDKIKEFINKNKDLEQLAFFYKRLVVNMIKNTYDMNDLIKMGNNNDDFLSYMNSAKNEINSDMREYNDKVKSHMLFRSLAYYLLENNYVDIKKLKNSEGKIYLPSKKIINILNSLSDVTGTIGLLNKLLEIGDMINTADKKTDSVFSLIVKL